MEHIYIILSQSGSIVSKFIKIATNKQFNHCSLSLDKELNRMYSMGRIYPSNPWIGGLVKEMPNVGTYLRFKETHCRILKVEVPKQNYHQLEDIVTTMYAHKKEYHYNVRGLLLGKFGYVRGSDHHFYCSEFVKYALKEAGIDVSFLSEIPLPEEFMKMPSSSVIYEGPFNDINKTVWLS